MSRRIKFLVAMSLLAAFCLIALIALRTCGLVRPFSVPTGAMSPAISAGDFIMTEGFTFLSRKPRRGDIVVFRTDGIATLPASTVYVMRIAGEPGEHLRISEGELFINDRHVSLSNTAGKIVYNMPPGAPSNSMQTDLIVPDGSCFVLGDNSTRSFDSRYWGGVPLGNIIGRVSHCYWPPGRVGQIK